MHRRARRERSSFSTGETSIPASSVPATERLIVNQVTFDPTVVKSRTATFTVKVKVKDTRGNVVRDALVFLRSTPLVTKRADDRDAVTAQDGWSTVTIVERDFRRSTRRMPSSSSSRRTAGRSRARWRLRYAARAGADGALTAP